MTDGNILSLITFLPLVGALIILVTRGDEATVARNARYVALWTTSITFVVSRCSHRTSSTVRVNGVLNSCPRA